MDEATARARKVLPRLARGEPQRVAVGLNLAEAELLQGILLEEGIPSFLRRTGGFDVPDFLAAGPARHPRARLRRRGGARLLRDRRPGAGGPRRRSDLASWPSS